MIISIYNCLCKELCPGWGSLYICRCHVDLSLFRVNSEIIQRPPGCIKIFVFTLDSRGYYTYIYFSPDI